MSKYTSDPLPSDDDMVDVIVIGSGLAGLSCAALLSHCQKRVVVLESHDIPGGCAHTWERRGYHFESGPSLYSGFSSTDGSPNPLKNIFQIVQEDCEWLTYDRWGTVLPNGKKFAAKIGPEEFQSVLMEHGGLNATTEFATLMERMKPISDAAQALTSMALREDIGVLFTLLLRYPKEVIVTLRQGTQLNNPFAAIMEELNIQDAFVKNWLDMLCFLLQGLPASGTLNTVMAYMLADWYRPGVTLDYPKGGSGAIVDTLVRAIRKHTGTVTMNSHVDEIIVEQNKAVGVRIRGSNTILRAKQAIVSNADPYITNQLLSTARSDGSLSNQAIEFFNQLTNTDPSTGGMSDLRSFIHLHAGIDGTDLPSIPSADFPAQWAVIRNWDGPLGVEEPRNIVLCSIPSMLDPNMAPSGNHVIHAYTPATEPCTYRQNLTDLFNLSNQS
jgi:phytoene dehydrogenase-like protein